jgi:tetratricopeptide (TPR) repeat protein
MLDKMMTAIVGVALFATTAQAQQSGNRAQARQQAKAADIDYRLGRFAAALDAYTRAYELYPVPALLFNIGQCHRNLKDHAKAIFFLEGYLRDLPTAHNRALVEDLIRESRAELERARAVTPTVEPAPPAEPARASSTGPRTATPESPPVVLSASSAGPGRGERPMRDDASSAGSRVWPGVLIGGGAAAVVAGAALYYYGQKRGPDEKFVYDDTRLVGGATLVLGGAAIVTGAILWRQRSAAAPVVGLAAHGGYVGWTGVF